MDPDYREDVDGTYEDQQVPNTYSCYSDLFNGNIITIWSTRYERYYRFKS